MDQLIFFALMIGLLVFMFSRTRKQQRNQQNLQNSVGVGAEVMTTSGQFGTVVSTEDEVITLEIAPGVHTRWTRRAVARVVTPVEAPVDESPVNQGPVNEATKDSADAGLDLRKDA